MINPASKSVKKPKIWSNFRLQHLIWVVLSGAAIVLLVFLIRETGMTSQKTVEIGSGQANSSIELHKGDFLRVTLEGNPTTGYNWEVSQVNSQILSQVGESQFQADSNAVGSGGKITIQFEAVGVGTTNLQLIYHRSWETNTPPLQTFAVTIKVDNK